MHKMLRIIFLAILLCPFLSYGQKVEEDKIKMGKTEASGFIATSKFGKTEVDEALASQLSKTGLSKHGKKKKFYTFKGVEWTTLGQNKIDLYYKVKKKRHKTKIYFIVSKGYDNYITSANDAPAAANIVKFLGQVDATVAYNEDIKQKELEVKAMNEKLEKDKADMKKAEDEKRKKEKEIEDMKKNK